MLVNRSVPPYTVVPEIPVSDVRESTAWLGHAFGFTVRIEMGSHRAQLNVGDGAIVLTQHAEIDRNDAERRRQRRSSTLVRVENVLAHWTRASERGAVILRPPADYPYGERQYTCLDPDGHTWTFSQTIADIAPEAWGAAASPP